MRVWLEPGYDHGRYGAWMLDWPGCFVWADSRDEVLSSVPAAVRRHADWLAGFGEPAVVPAADDVQIVEEVAAGVKQGYEINATFGADRRAVDSGELETMLRQLDFARADLGRLRQRIAAAAALGAAGAAGPPRDAAAIALGGAAPRRTDDVLRHVAGSEIWLASRLDRTLRFSGAPRDGDLSIYLDETRGWMVEQLRGLQAREPALETADGKGEEWTLAKVLRRALYHNLDHLAELEARFASRLD